jgi:hypothetical protein
MVVDTPPPPPGPSSVFVFGRSTFIAPTGDGSARPIAAPVPAAVAAQANNEELQKLKDRLEAKKKKLARLRGAVSSKTAPVTVRADASFLVPSSAGTAKDKTGSTSCPPHQESFMQGNTIRFSNPTNPHAQSHKPDNLLPYSAKVTDDSGTLLVDLAADDAGLTTEIRRDLRDKLAEAQATLTELVAFLALDEAIEFGQPRERELLERARRQLSDVADKWEVDRKREEKHQVDLEPTQKVQEEALTLDANPQQLHDRQPEKPQRQELESSEKDRVEQEHQAQMVEMEQARMVAWLW